MNNKTAVRIGAMTSNHNESLRVRSGVRAGALSINHNQGLKVRTSVKAGLPPGPCVTNHNQTASQLLKVKTDLRAGKSPNEPKEK